MRCTLRTVRFQSAMQTLAYIPGRCGQSRMGEELSAPPTVREEFIQDLVALGVAPALAPDIEKLLADKWEVLNVSRVRMLQTFTMTLMTQAARVGSSDVYARFTMPEMILAMENMKLVMHKAMTRKGKGDDVGEGKPARRTGPGPSDDGPALYG